MDASGGPRIAPGNRRQLGWINFAMAKLAGVAMRGKPPNIFTTLGRHRRLVWRWLWFASALMPGGKLPREESELVILRVAHNTGSEYEWSHHERLGARAGLSEAEISRVRIGPDAPGWSERQELLLRAADEMHNGRQIEKELWARLTAHFDEVRLIEICVLIGHYEMLAMILNTLEVQPERPARL